MGRKNVRSSTDKPLIVVYSIHSTLFPFRSEDEAVYEHPIARQELLDLWQGYSARKLQGR
jgi:hypothetical protein